MWRKRACSILLSFMMAITAIPISAMSVYAADAQTVQEAPGTEETAGSVETEAADAAVSQEEAAEGTEPEAEEEAGGNEAPQEDAEASVPEEAGSETEVSETEEAAQTEGEDAAKEQISQEPEEQLPQEAEEMLPGESDDVRDEAAGMNEDAVSAEEETDGEAAGSESTDQAGTVSAPEDAADPSAENPEVTSDQEEMTQDAEPEITAQPLEEAAGEDAADAAEAQYNVSITAERDKWMIMPGESLVLYANASRSLNGTVSDEGLLYKWEIASGNDGGYASLKGDIEGEIGEYPSATLQIGDLSTGVLSDSSEFTIIVKVTIYDGTDQSGNPAEKASTLSSDITVKDEYFEIFPHQIEGIAVGDSITIPLSIMYCSSYNDTYAYGMNVSWKFEYDDTILELTDESGNRVDAAGETAVSAPAGQNETKITIRRLTDTIAFLKITALFSYVDHNGNLHGNDLLPGEEYSQSYELYPLDTGEIFNGNIRFDIDDNRIFSDGEYTFDLQKENIPGEYEIELEVGHYDDQGLVEAYTEGAEYDFDPDTEKLTLHGNKIREKGFFWFGYTVKAVAKEDGRVLCQEHRNGLESREAKTEYRFEEHLEFLPGWYDTVNHWEDVYVENAEHPDGWDTRYEVTNVEIESQDPAEAGRDVVEIRVYYENDDQSSDQYWWHYEGRNHGTAVLRVYYKDLNGEERSYTFDVSVQGDTYGVSIRTDDGSTRALPGETITLLTDVWHHSENSENEGKTEGLVYAWNLKGNDGEGPDPDTFATLRTADSGKTASVEFRLPENAEEDWYGTHVEVFIYLGEIAEENKVGYHSIWLDMAAVYEELWPARIDPSMDVGQSQTIQAELRRYSAANDNQYDLVGDETEVTYYWYYDDKAVIVYDRDGNRVGNRDEAGEYIGSDACTGRSCPFTIYRRRQWETQIFLEAVYTNEDGEEFREGQQLRLEGKDYRVWLEEQDDRVYSDGTYSYPVTTEGLSDDAVYGTDYQIDITVGLWGEDEIADPFTKGIEYDFDGSTLTLYGEKLEERGLDDDCEFGVEMLLKTGGESVWVENRDFRFRKARIDYDRENDRDMLPGWDGSVSGSYHVYIENSEHPDGYDNDYKVTDVKVLSDDPWEGEEGNVITDFHRDQNENDPSDYWYFYKVENRGDAVLQVTYEDVDGQEQTYTFALHVGDEVYDVWIGSEGGEYEVLPGGRIELFAEARHEYFDEDGNYHNDKEGLDYQWSFAFGSEFARLEVNEGDHSKASLIFNDLPEGQDWIDENVAVTVTILDAQGNETNGRTTSPDYWVHTYYEEIRPLILDQSLDLGASIKDRKFEVRRYVYGEDGYEVLDGQYDIRYEWSYDENAFSITETRDGKEVKVVSGETAETDTFTFTRLETWGTNCSVKAYWEDEDGDRREIWNNYWFEDKHYEIWFDRDDEVIRDDEEKTFAVNTENLGGLDCELLFIVNYQAAEEVYVDMTEGVEYTIDPSGTSVTVNGDLVERKIRSSEVNRNEFYIGAAILYKGEVYQDSFRWCRVEMERTGKSMQQISASDVTMTMVETAEASVTGAQGALTFTSGDESIVKVDAQTGTLTPVAPGTAQIIVKAAETEDYRPGSTAFHVTVEKLDLSKTTVQTSGPAAGFPYNGKVRKPSLVTVTYKGVKLVNGQDYTATFPEDLINVGTKTVTVKAAGSRTTGSTTAAYKIIKGTQSITVTCPVDVLSVSRTTTITITGAKGTKTYKSSNTDIATVSSDGKVTAKKVGTVQIKAIAGSTSNYNYAAKTLTFKIVPGVTGSLTLVNYATGIRATWTQVAGADGYLVYRSGKLIATITKGTTVTYFDKAATTNGAKYTYKIVAKASTGSSRLSRSKVVYRVARPTITSLTNSGAGRMTVKWGKNASATGYQVQCSLSSTFASGNKTFTVTNVSTLTKVIGSLTKGKTYYVRVRTYKNVDPARYYSAWSSTKTVKITK